MAPSQEMGPLNFPTSKTRCTRKVAPWEHTQCRDKVSLLHFGCRLTPRVTQHWVATNTPQASIRRRQKPMLSTTVANAYRGFSVSAATTQTVLLVHYLTLPLLLLNKDGHLRRQLLQQMQHPGNASQPRWNTHERHALVRESNSTLQQA